LILALVECSLGPIIKITRVVDKADKGGRTRAGIIESSSKSSKSEGKLYHLSSLSLVYLLEYLSSNESKGEESFNWLSNKPLGKSNRPLKIAIIINQIKQRKQSIFS
jgi:hypothetical protein